MEAVSPARFDRVARIYRPMEYLSFGPMLERCRFVHLPALAFARKALVIGDGDGRFTARLLHSNQSVQIDAVDASPAMLRLLKGRAARRGAQSRVRTFCADARIFTPRFRDYDLVVTHFFLDCLSAAETADLILRVRSHLAPNATWLVSEFQAPEESRFRAALARLLIAALYKAFGLLTGLRVREIPPWRDLLEENGFVPARGTQFLAGVLISELWELHSATVRESIPSHEREEMGHKDEMNAQRIPGIDPGPVPSPEPPEPEPIPAPGPAPEPDPQPYPGPIPAPQPVTRKGHPTLDEYTAGWSA
ncbi:MAG TPA: class I SAM-dependent methyltransferase [Acidobacteriaceae bacterium]|nr:class I SAM-dependent methyltransferase [Acidobacteriaceae bacterium]